MAKPTSTRMDLEATNKELHKELGQYRKEIENLRNQMARFEYLASYELSHQYDNAKNSRRQFHKGALEAMQNYNRKWKDATGRNIERLW